MVHPNSTPESFFLDIYTSKDVSLDDLCLIEKNHFDRSYCGGQNRFFGPMDFSDFRGYQAYTVSVENVSINQIACFCSLEKALSIEIFPNSNRRAVAKIMPKYWRYPKISIFRGQIDAYSVF